MNDLTAEGAEGTEEERREKLGDGSAVSLQYYLG